MSQETKPNELSDIIINENEHKLFDISNSNNNNNEPMDRLKRIKSICRIYVKWINYHKPHDDEEECEDDENIEFISMYDIINNKLSETYDFKHFLSDYHFIINRKDLLLNEEMKDNEIICDAETCSIINRNNRDREYYGNNNNKRNQLYFINNYIDDDENNVIRNISTQQILDSLHTFIDHTIHIDNNAFIELYNKSKQDDNDDNDDLDFNTFCHDEYAQKVIQLIENKRNSSKRYRIIDENTVCSNNKFMTTNDIESMNGIRCNDDDDNGDNNDDDESTLKPMRCFIDHFILTMDSNKMDKCEISELYDFLCDEEYDSESIIQDLEDKKYSNLLNYLSHSIIFNDISHRLLIEKQVSSSLYSCGYRYFYWDYYKNNNHKRTVIFGSVTGDENHGYKLKHWYISQKYKNLKYEILNNKIKTFSLEQYNTTIQKATDKLNAWKNEDDVQPLICNTNAWNQYYGIKKNEEIKLNHILALLFYTNYSKQCFEFSRTYRKINEYETDFELKQRHREYYHWGRALRECVECFGVSMENAKIGVFFHGINASLIFNSTTIRLCGPVSTTGKFDIAVSIFGATGIVLDIKRRDVNQFYFDCPYWSDYAHEDEKLFIGGLVNFEFDTIRDMKLKLNYWNYIQSLTMFHFMIEGWQFTKKIKKKHYAVLKLLIKEEMAEKVLTGSKSTVPEYILKLWHHFLSQIKYVEINWKYMRMHESSSRKRYGYKTFAPTFCLKHFTSLDFKAFLRILPNLETITLYNGKKNKWMESIELSEIFTEHILDTIDIINTSPTLKESFKAFNIVLPCHDEIVEYIMENEDEFNNKGWELGETTYHSMFHHAFKPCSDTLKIFRA